METCTPTDDLALEAFEMAKKKTGRPPKDRTKDEYLEVRLDKAEKKAFKDAAEIAGLAVSTWVRIRLRDVAKKELEAAGKPVAFVENPAKN